MKQEDRLNLSTNEDLLPDRSDETSTEIKQILVQNNNKHLSHAHQKFVSFVKKELSIKTKYSTVTARKYTALCLHSMLNYKQYLSATHNLPTACRGALMIPL